MAPRKSRGKTAKQAAAKVRRARAERARRKKRASKIEKPFERHTEKVSPQDVVLEAGKGNKTTGGGEGGHFWHVYLNAHHAGRAYINFHADADEGPHASVTVWLNKEHRGKGIGAVAFRRAAEGSAYDTVFATLRKENVGSRIALERAGFEPDPTWTGSQLRYVWRRT
jgi:predicted ribosome quality control (RQC) complex YloA/Tae2 family protein